MTLWLFVLIAWIWSIGVVAASGGYQLGKQNATMYPWLQGLTAPFWPITLVVVVSIAVVRGMFKKLSR